MSFFTRMTHEVKEFVSWEVSSAIIACTLVLVWILVFVPIGFVGNLVLGETPGLVTGFVVATIVADAVSKRLEYDRPD